MRFKQSLIVLVLIALAGPTLAASAQARPSAQALSQAPPALVTQLQQRIITSGMSPEQVRARLRAEGYSDNLFDGYMSQLGGEIAEPEDDVFSAMRALGIVDDTDLNELLRLSGRATTGSRSGSSTSAATPGPTIFGLSMFRDATSLFLPNLDGPVDAGYRLGPGDQLVLILTGEVELAYMLDVTREGFVVIPQVGQIGVANLTLGELESLLYTRLGRAYSGVRRGADATTRFSVSVSRLRSNQIFVTGDVMAPGSYRVTSAGTALTALYAAGGPTDHGSLRRIEVRRGGTLVSSLDLYDYLLRGDGSRDVRLQQGDVVFVPVQGRRARVEGSVTRPAIYEVAEGESLADLVKAAGGLLATAGGRRLVIERVLPVADRSAGRDRAFIEVPLGTDGTLPGIPIEDGDVVRVPAVAERVRGGITVRGHVWAEGQQGYTAGETLEGALRRAGGLKPDGYIGTVHVSRLMQDSTRAQLRAMLRDTTGATIEPFALQEDDEITVYSRTSFRPDRYVAISGAVRSGGRFPWRSGMTLRDLVLMSGGLEEQAYLKEAEIVRRSVDGDLRTDAIAVRVALDSSYRFDQPASAAATHADDARLEPYDNVLILLDPDWRAPRSVILTGEVRFPGRFTLTTRSDRLSDLIARAGGLTTEADAGGAYFARMVDTVQSQRIALAEQRRSDGGTRPDEVRTRIRVGVDLAAAIREQQRSDNLMLLQEDSIHVPKLLQTVEVRGAVNAPTALAHAAGRRLGHYIGAAGGSTERARTSRAYVIQPNGKIESRRQVLWIFRSNPTPRPGATVVVPVRGEEAPGVGGALTSIAASIAMMTQIVVSLATLMVLLR